MTALSIAEAERRAVANPQVTAPRKRGTAEDADLASVTDLAGAAAARYRRARKIPRAAGVSRPAPARRRVAPVRVTLAPPEATAAGNARVTARPGRPETSAAPIRPAASRGAAPGRRAAPIDAASRVASRQARPAPLRLTARGRKVVAGLAVAIGAAAVCLISLTAAGGADAASHGQPGAGFHGMQEVWGSNPHSSTQVSHVIRTANR